MQTLTLEIRKHYGRTDLYPSCEDSHLLAALMQGKCFAKPDLDILEALGYTFTFQFAGHPVGDPRKEI